MNIKKKFFTLKDIHLFLRRDSKLIKNLVINAIDIQINIKSRKVIVEWLQDGGISGIVTIDYFEDTRNAVLCFENKADLAMFVLRFGKSDE